jgi:signal transduction histidine kinase
MSDDQPERAKTNESLAAERAKTDATLLAREAVEREADAIVERARKEADGVLTAARADADDKLGNPLASERAAIAEERAVADELVESARTTADVIVNDERAARNRLLARLLPFERDNTDLHLLVERARSDQALASRDDFLGMVSHDLRDLLAGIVVNSSCIVEEKASASDIRSCVDRIQRSAARMTRLIGDLVDIASIDAGKLAILAAEADAQNLVDEAAITWRPQASAKGITLESVAPGPLTAAVDQGRILQVLGNLITNAIKFSPQGGTISVGVEQGDGEVRFSVRDAGAGIPADKLQVVFERFWQVGKNDRRGLGLGLYISRCLVEAHGGRIWVESEVGAGSLFSFTVPSAVRS